jgi:hypothetical protein
LLVPLLVMLALERAPKERLRREGLAALASVAACVAIVHLVVRELPPHVEGMSRALPVLAREAWISAQDPARLLRRLHAEFVRPWLAVSSAPLLCVLPGGGLRLATRLVALGTAAAGALFVAAYIPLAGQYGLVLCPVLALGVAHGLGRAAERRALAPCAAVALIVTAALAPGEHARLAADPDRDWARAVAPALPPNATVLCLDRSRMMRIEELTGAAAVDFRPAGDRGAAGARAAIERARRGAEQRGQALFLDGKVLEAAPHYPTLAPIVEQLRAVATLTPVAGGKLVRIR